jgi:hypothetical protein
MPILTVERVAFETISSQLRKEPLPEYLSEWEADDLRDLVYELSFLTAGLLRVHGSKAKR